MMETQSDSIDIASIKDAALRSFEVSFNPAGSVSATADGVIFPCIQPPKAANFDLDVSSNDHLRATEHAFPRSAAAARTPSSSQHTGCQAVGTGSEPGQNVAQQNTCSILASTVPETQAPIDVGDPLPSGPHVVAAEIDRLPKKMSTQGSLPQDTQPVSQSIYENILSKVKIVRQPEQDAAGVGGGDGGEYEEESLQEGDDGHIDLLSSYKGKGHELADDSDPEPVEFSPTQTQHGLSQFPESQRFKTPGTTSRKRNYNGEIVETPSLPRNPLARSGAPTPGKMMGLSQAFAATQAVSSPLVNCLPSGPLSDRPSPNIKLQARPATVTLSSPLHLRSDLRKTATEPYQHYKSIKQSQAERERASLFGQNQRDTLGDNVSDDDFDDEPSLLERSRRLKEREQKVRQQLQAVSSPNRARSSGSVGPLSSPTSRPQLSSPRPSPRSYGRRTGHMQDDFQISVVPEEPENVTSDPTNDSEEETEQEGEVEIARSSQNVVHDEEDKENLGLAGLEVPETVGRLQNSLNSYHGLESSPSVRQSAGSDLRRDVRLESSGVEPFAVANSQPLQLARKPAHQLRTPFTSIADGVNFVPQSQFLESGTYITSSLERTGLLQSSTNAGGEVVDDQIAEPNVFVERTSSGNDRLPSIEPRMPETGSTSGMEVNEDPKATVQSARRTLNEVSIACMIDRVVQDPPFASSNASMTVALIPETSSLSRRESESSSSAPKLDGSKPASFLSGQLPRSSAEFETAKTHLSTTAGDVFPSLPRQPSYVKNSPSGRKRQRMIEITNDPSPRKSGGDVDIDVAMEIVVDQEFQSTFDSSSPIPPGRHRRRRPQEHQANTAITKAMPSILEQLERVSSKPDNSHGTALESDSPLPRVYGNSEEPTQNSSQATRPILHPANLRRQFAAPVQKLARERATARHSRARDDLYDVQVSPHKSEMAKSNRPPAKISKPPSTLPARKRRGQVPAGRSISPTQTGRLKRPGSQGSVFTTNESSHPLTTDASRNDSSGSNVLLGEVVAPNQVLACFNGKTRAYYPASCLGITGSDSLRYRIQWEGFEADETDARGVRQLDLRIGDAVKVNMEGFPKVSHIVRGFKDKVLPSGQGGPMTDIRGYSVLLVAPKQRKSLPVNLSAENLKDVPISAIYLDSNMWSQMKGREYEYVPQQPTSVLGFATPPERPSTPATPSSRSRRSLALSTNTAPCELVGIFARMAFAISYDEARKSSLTHLIRTNGGIVLHDGFHELFANDSITPKPDYANLGFTALIADRHSRKEKYMQALALNLPCLSGRWIESCVAKEAVVDWQPYLLPAGESAVLDGAIRSRVLPSIPAPSIAKMTEITGMRPRLLNSSAVIFVTGRGKAEEKRKPFVFLTQAIGAGRIDKVIDLKAAKALLDGDDSQSKDYRWVFVDDALFVSAKTLLEKEQGEAVDRVRVVGNEYICQSLILGGMVED